MAKKLAGEVAEVNEALAAAGVSHKLSEVKYADGLVEVKSVGSWLQVNLHIQGTSMTALDVTSTILGPIKCGTRVLNAAGGELCWTARPCHRGVAVI